MFIHKSKPEIIALDYSTKFITNFIKQHLTKGIFLQIITTELQIP